MTTLSTPLMRLRHSIAALAVSIISAAALARPPLYEWIAVSNMPVPAAKITLDNGKQHALKEFKGNVVLVNLWATWCTPCLEELPTLDRLEQELAKEGLVVVTLSLDTNKTFKDLRRYTDENGLRLAHLAFDHTQAFSRWALQGLPVTVLIDRNGVARYQYHGATDWLADSQKEKIRELLA